MTTTTRDEAVWSLTDCLCDARIAAQSGHPCECPWPKESRLWLIWHREYHREIQRIVDARAAVRRGRISEAEREADSEDEQPRGLLAWVLRLLGVQ